MVFGSVPKKLKNYIIADITVILRHNARFFSLHGSPHRGPSDASSQSRFSLRIFFVNRYPQIFGAKALLFDSDHAECLLLIAEND